MRDWLKTARTEKQLTMKEIGVKLGISESYYCLIENGTRQVNMDIGLAASIATILGISMEKVAQLEAEWKKQSATYQSDAPMDPVLSSQPIGKSG